MTTQPTDSTLDNSAMKSANSCASVEHYTPHHIVEKVTKVLGHIDLDPASSILVNKTIIKANKIFTKEDDSLNLPDENWLSNTIFLNPPGGFLSKSKQSNRWVSSKRGSSAQRVWFDKLYNVWLDNKTKHAIYLGFNIEILRTMGDVIKDLPFCIPSDRIKFITENFTPSNAPRHANIIVLLSKDSSVITRFKREFSDIGAIIHNR